MLFRSCRLDSNGRLLVGTSTARANFFNSTQSSNIQLEGTTGNAVMSLTGCGGNPAFVLARAGGSTVGSTTVVSSGDLLGRITFQGSDGTEFVQAADITAEVDATPGANDMPGRLVFSTTADGASSPTERMRINSDGSISLGSPGDVSSAVSTTGFRFVYGSGFWWTTTGGNSYWNVSTQTYFNLRYNGSGSGAIIINNGSVNYNSSSDYRIKENVVPLIGAIDRVNQLKPYRFNLIVDPDKTVDGFFAHEAQDVVPEAVSGEKDAMDDEGNPIYQGIDQSKLVPLVVAALQEALVEIETLKAEVAALKAK